MNPPLSDLTDTAVWIPQHAYPLGRWRTRCVSSKRKDSKLNAPPLKESLSKEGGAAPIKAPLD